MIDFVRTARGSEVRYATRPDTNDGALRDGIVVEDEYGLRDLPPLTGWAIDIGAHIGTVTMALGMDHPALQIIAVEALAENAAVLRQNVALNGLADRVHVIEAAAGSEDETEPIPIRYGWTEPGYWHDSRYIGGMAGNGPLIASCPVTSLERLMAEFGIDRVSLLKIDCEGCEWFVLTSPAVARIDRIWGEMHAGRHGDAARLRALLEPTHEVEMDDAKIVSLFRAVRRA